jgi:hypothetical protein
MRRNQTHSNDFLLDFIFYAQYSDKNRMKTQIWHESLSFMLKRKRSKSAFEMSNINVFFFSIIKDCVQREDVVICCANKRFRRCISLIASFVCDYEEQMLIIDVKRTTLYHLSRIVKSSKESRKSLIVAHARIHARTNSTTAARRAKFSKWEMNSWDKEFCLRLFFDQYSRDHNDRHFASIVQEHDDASFESNSISSEKENVDQIKTQRTNDSSDWFIWFR